LPLERASPSTRELPLKRVGDMIFGKNDADKDAMVPLFADIKTHRDVVIVVEPQA